MSSNPSAGPYRLIESVEGQPVPYYVVPFDADGLCTGPQTRQHLVDAASGYSDIFLFSHGWNNDWTTATGRYESFIRGVQALRREHHLPMPAGYKPLLVGIFWPSQALAWFDSEVGPGFAGGDPVRQDQAAGLDQGVLRDVAQALPAARRERFYALAQADRVDAAEARELAEMLAAATRADDEGARGDAPSATDLLVAAQSIEAPAPDLNQVGISDGVAADPQAAIGLGDLASKLDPRNLLKPFTVWQMKDRAGVVGHRGVAPLLQALLDGSQARIHLLGHSFGCKVVMTALCTPASLSRPVESALLLQPAISQYAFADAVPDRDQVKGGFALAPERVRRAIVATYSDNDVALTKLFHLAVRRSDDRGELQFAGEGSTPSRYAAMGGFGPQASGARFTSIQDPGGDYDFGDGTRILAVNGTRTISGHGDISNPATWWLSYLLSKD